MKWNEIKLPPSGFAFNSFKGGDMLYMNKYFDDIDSFMSTPLWNRIAGIARLPFAFAPSKVGNRLEQINDRFDS